MSWENTVVVVRTTHNIKDKAGEPDLHKDGKHFSSDVIGAETACHGHMHVAQSLKSFKQHCC